ncbi:MAG: hypothetical protein BWY98_00789 [Tenericutes bacterium ADurb.BinA155]|jgi:VanZ family protein|nr:MAG: hypothetical protein BWY98_00789 [Tenericutes bacterium ADurb.BinA155]
MAKRWIYFALMLIGTGLIIFSSTRTGAEHDEEGGVIITWINQTFFAGNLSAQEQTSIVGVGAKLLGHFCLFMLTGLFASLFLASFPKLGIGSFWILLAYSIVLASLGEIIQIFAAGRSPTLHDVFLDFTGFWSILLFKIVYRKEHPKKRI